MVKSRHASDGSSGSKRPRRGKCSRKTAYLAGKRILPKGITGREKLSSLLRETFLAYNSARLREGCELLVERMLEPDVTVGLSLAGALTPAGLGCSCVVPLIRAGFVDWIVSTGANLYHDLHFALNLPLHVGSNLVDGAGLRRNEVVRIYDVLFDYKCLLRTDAWTRRIFARDEFQRTMSSSELHWLLGKHAAACEATSARKNVSLLAAAYRCGVPVYTPSPGDSSIGMNIAEMQLKGSKLCVDASLDVNETTAIVLSAKRSGGRSGVLLMGGGSPKNFVLQTEPHIQEVLGLDDDGHNYFLQVTDARADTGGLSGATPQEAVSWGKVAPATLPDAVVCYADTTIVLPLLTHYALANHAKRKLKRLYDKRGELMKFLKKECNARRARRGGAAASGKKGTEH